jgi:hypothetical protein
VSPDWPLSYKNAQAYLFEAISVPANFVKVCMNEFVLLCEISVSRVSQSV